MTCLRWRRRLLLPVVLLALSGCQLNFALSQAPGTGAAAPSCLLQQSEQIQGAVVLMAQSVPTAQVLPCLRRLPEGWTVGGFHARKGRSRIWLVVGMGNRRALTVTLTRRCTLTGASEAQSDIDGATRFDRERSTGALLRGTRSYVFPGSCLTYDYSFIDTTALPVLATSIGTIARADVAARLAQDSRGRLHLDPDPERST